MLKGKQKTETFEGKPVPSFPTGNRAVPAEAEARFDILIRKTNKRPLTTDWSAIKYELNRLREANAVAETKEWSGVIEAMGAVEPTPEVVDRVLAALGVGDPVTQAA